MKREVLAALCAIFAAFTIALVSCTCAVEDRSPEPSSSREAVVNDIMMYPEGSFDTHRNWPTDDDYQQSADALSRYLTMRGVSVDYQTALDYLKRQGRTDMVGMYLASQRFCSGKKGVIMAKKNNFRMLPTPILVLVDGKWLIMGFTSELEVKCYDSHGDLTDTYPPTRFEAGYFASDQEAVFVTDWGYSSGL